MGVRQQGFSRCQFQKIEEEKQENWDHEELVWTKINGPLTFMLRTSPKRLVKNLPLSTDGAENAGVSSKTSFTTWLVKNLLASVDIAENTEVSGNKDGDNKMAKYI